MKHNIRRVGKAVVNSIKMALRCRFKLSSAEKKIYITLLKEITK